MSYLRYGIRVLLKTPTFTVVAIVTLALGIGANTAIFTVLNAALLKPLPFLDPDRIVQIQESHSNAADLNLLSHLEKMTKKEEEQTSKP